MYLLALLFTLLPLSLAANAELQIKRTLTHTCNRRTQNGDMVAMHYIGTLQADGTEFDQSYKRGQPLSFQLGSGRVIKGWDQGLLDMCPGDKRTLTIPPELGYGDRGMGPIPAKATLVFDTELVSIGGVPEEPKVVVQNEEMDEAGAKMAEKVNEAVKEEAKEEVRQKGEEQKKLEEEAASAAATEASKAEPAEPSAEQNPQEEKEKEKKDELKKDEL